MFTKLRRAGLCLSDTAPLRHGIDRIPLLYHFGIAYMASELFIWVNSGIFALYLELR